MVTRRRFYQEAKALQFGRGENRLEKGRWPESQARAEKLLPRRVYLRKEFEGLRGDFRKCYEGVHSCGRMC